MPSDLDEMKEFRLHLAAMPITVKALVLFSFSSCCSGYDCGLDANIQTRQEYARFLNEHSNYDVYRNWPLMFDPEKGGWVLR